MTWDFAWMGDPSAWFGLATLILLEVVLGIDNLIFISILSSRLPEKERQRAFSTGLTLALVMRLALLSAIAWIVTLKEPLLTAFGHSLSARDLILMVGGVFLLFKGTLELHERLEGGNSAAADTARPAIYWHVLAQIVMLDAIFSLDSIITSVGMVQDLTVMMLAVCIAMVVMLLAARPLTNFVERHPSVIVLCLGFLLTIGLSLILDGVGLPIPKGYLYAAIVFSLLVEMFNHLALRSRRKRITPRNLRESAARAVLGLLGGERQSGTAPLDMEALATGTAGGEVFAPEECAMVARVIRLGGQRVRHIMTPRRRMVFLMENASRQDLFRLAAASAHSCLPVLRQRTDEVLGFVHLGDALALCEDQQSFDLVRIVRPAPSLLEHTPLPDVLDCFRKEASPLVLVRDEYGSVVGMVSAQDVLHAMAGRMGEDVADADALRPLRQTDGSWLLPGRLSVDALRRILGSCSLPETSAATLAGVVLEQCGRIPAVGDVGQCENWEWKVLHMDSKRIAELRVRCIAGDSAGGSCAR